MRIMDPWAFQIWLRRAKEGHSCIYAANVLGFAFMDADPTSEAARLRDISQDAWRRGEVFLFHRLRKTVGMRPVYDYVATRSSLRAQTWVDKISRMPFGIGRDYGDETNG